MCLSWFTPNLPPLALSMSCEQFTFLRSSVYLWSPTRQSKFQGLLSTATGGHGTMTTIT